MAEDTENESKTEEATGRRLEEARKQGDVPKSPELSQAAGLLGGFTVLVGMGGYLAQDMAVRLTPFFAHPDSIALDGQGGVGVARYAIMTAMPAMAAVMGAALVCGVAANVLQTGFMFVPSKLAPDFSRLDLMKGLQRLFGLDGFIQFLRAAAKVLLTGLIAGMVLWPRAKEFGMLATLDPMAILPYALDMAKRLFIAVMVFTAGVAGIDYIWQRIRFAQKMRMTKEEVKEDFKQTEGDPHVKAKQRQIRIERSRRRMMAAVPKATVVVMNPTHYAVALRYVQGETPAPECVAKGVDAVALKIREVAEEANVPVIEDPPLARALYATVEVDEIIPQQHYEAVAKIIGFILAAAKSPKRARQL
ncbi:flagellar biosynthesis protein FlhB [Caulobacter sp. KR2-114]|uniref:flagellar biosynthesis protein FlhB n=1 Tax=Caulobacter sp. KR2-114 TaxID=3400912 RepID=UPI003C09EDB8